MDGLQGNIYPLTKYVIIMSEEKDEKTLEERVQILEGGFESARK